jgi:spore coat polysaccharide biosynthesis predicted glycosyltransferase SpsG
MERILLVCRASESVGIGHLSRVERILKALSVYAPIKLRLAVIGPSIQRDNLLNFDHKFYADNLSFKEVITNEVNFFQPNTIVFDVYSSNIDFTKLFQTLKQNKIKLVAVDGLTEYHQLLDLIWTPSFMSPKLSGNDPHKLSFGWDHFLLDDAVKTSKWRNGKEILVLTGGSDPTGLNKDLPKMLDEHISNCLINWVRGPFSNKPILNNVINNEFNVIKSPQEIQSLISSANYVLTVYGVSFFESCHYGKPTSVFSPYKDRDDKELGLVNKANIAMTAVSAKEAVINLSYLINNFHESQKISVNGSNKVKNGTHLLANKIYNLH